MHRISYPIAWLEARFRGTHSSFNSVHHSSQEDNGHLGLAAKSRDALRFQRAIQRVCNRTEATCSYSINRLSWAMQTLEACSGQPVYWGSHQYCLPEIPVYTAIRNRQAFSSTHSQFPSNILQASHTSSSGLFQTSSRVLG